MLYNKKGDILVSQEEHKQYVDTTVLIEELEKEMKLNFFSIRDRVKNAKVYITEKEIKKYLMETYEIETNDLIQEVKNHISKLSSKELDMFSMMAYNGLAHRPHESKYQFKPDVLDYYNNCILIMKYKCLILLDILFKLVNNNTDSIQQELDYLDIKLNEKGKILYEDVLRLINSTVYNLKDLFKKVEIANNPSSYFYYPTMEYPSSLLQMKSINHIDDNIDGFIPLTEKQKEEIKQENKEDENKKIILNNSLVDLLE